MLETFRGMLPLHFVPFQPFSLERIIKPTDTDHVVYKAEHKNCRRFPDPGDKTLKAGVNRNFQIFAPLDFIAEIT